MKTVLVTGGKGFIGGALVEALIKRGDDVVVIDNQSSEGVDYHINAKAKYYEEDVANLQFFAQLFTDYRRFDLVYHLAAVSSIKDSFEKPALTFLDNGLGTSNVLEFCRFSRPHKMVFTSTAAVYGTAAKIPFKEADDSDHLLNPYSLSKYQGEELCRLYHELFQIEPVALRLFNVYGPRASSESVIPRFLKQKALGEPLTLYGLGEDTRDYIHVEDVVQALLLAGESGISTSGQVLNVGSGKEHSVKDLAQMIDPDGERGVGPTRSRECKNVRADISKIKKELGWKPKIKLESYIEKELKRLTKDQS